MSENELYQDYDRSIMIQDCNAFVNGILLVPDSDNKVYVRQFRICLN
jgi:hypothetical protein